MVSQFSLQTFEPLLTTLFSVRLADCGAVDLCLESARSLGERNADKFAGPFVLPETVRTQPFSLIFRGPNDAPLTQGNYAFAHPALGEFDLFIVPVGKDSGGLYYEAVFT